MNCDDLFALARQAGAHWQYERSHPVPCVFPTDESLKRFSELVAAAQLEVCIQACDSVDIVGADECIAAIRARGQV